MHGRVCSGIVLGVGLALLSVDFAQPSFRVVTWEKGTYFPPAKLDRA